MPGKTVRRLPVGAASKFLGKSGDGFHGGEKYPILGGLGRSKIEFK